MNELESDIATTVRPFRIGVSLPILLLALSAAAGVTMACSSDPAASSPGGSEEEGIEIQFPKMYSAVTDGTREFKVPAIVNGVKSVTWSASDPDMVDLEPGTDGKSVTIIPRKAGTVAIVAKSGSLKGTAELVVTQATEQEWSDGSERYNNGVVLKRPERPDGGGGGRGDGGGDRPQRQPPDPSLACTNCHANGKQDVEHTPMQTAGYSDDELVAIFTKGEKPAGAEQRVMKNAEAWKSMHQWAMEPEELRGVVVYLRALEPKSQGDVDFGGRRSGAPPASGTPSK